MELITGSVVPDRWRQTRVQLNQAEMQYTQMPKVEIEIGKAKVTKRVPTNELGESGGHRNVEIRYFQGKRPNQKGQKLKFWL